MAIILPYLDDDDDDDFSFDKENNKKKKGWFIFLQHQKLSHRCSNGNIFSLSL